MRFLFLGAGAIGTYIGGSLAAAGESVAFIEQPGPAQVIAERGLVLQLRSGRKVVRESEVYTSASDALRRGPYDVAVFALKSFDTEDALTGLLDTGLDVPPVLSLQNGVDNEAALAGRLGEDRVIAGTITSAVGKPGIGEIVEEKHRGVGIALGHPLSERLVGALDAAGLTARGFPAPGPMKWSKLLTNLTGNATSAILDMTVGEIFADRRLYDVEVAVLRECLAVMRALGYAPVDLPGTPVRALALAAEKLPRFVAQPALTRALASGRGDKMPSFHIDLHSGRGKSEVGWLNGAVVRHGAGRGVATPVNRVLTETLQALTEGREDVARFRRNPDALLDLVG